VSVVAALALIGLAVGLVFQTRLWAAYDAEALARQAEQEQRKKAEEAYGQLEEVHRKEVDLKRQLAWTAYRHAIGFAARDWQDGEVDAARLALRQSPAEHRRWEWHYLRRLCDGNLWNLAGHQGPIWSVACSPD